MRHREGCLTIVTGTPGQPPKISRLGTKVEMRRRGCAHLLIQRIHADYPSASLLVAVSRVSKDFWKANGFIPLAITSPLYTWASRIGNKYPVFTSCRWTQRCARLIKLPAFAILVQYESHTVVTGARQRHAVTSAVAAAAATQHVQYQPDAKSDDTL